MFQKIADNHDMNRGNHRDRPVNGNSSRIPEHFCGSHPQQQAVVAVTTAVQWMTQDDAVDDGPSPQLPSVMETSKRYRSVCECVF
ncbi:hypothetical protein J6590_034119 [Homalodisca vitripennis]|nr:hypothetical protein J6590_034119 [Homalodisca vitripennis]